MDIVKDLKIVEEKYEGKRTYTGEIIISQMARACRLEIEQLRETIALNQSPATKSCVNCVHQGNYENEIECGYPCPCLLCARRAVDHFKLPDADGDQPKGDLPESTKYTTMDTKLAYIDRIIDALPDGDAEIRSCKSCYNYMMTCLALGFYWAERRCHYCSNYDGWTSVKGLRNEIAEGKLG